MGLSNMPKETIATYQVLIEIAQAVKALASDPKALEKAAKDAYALPAAEEEKANSLRATIAQNQELVAAQKKQLADIDKQNADIAAKSQKIADAKQEIEARSTDLDKREARVKETEQAQGRLKNDLATEKRNLEVAHSALDTARHAFEVQKLRINDYEAELKAKAAKLKDITEGL